MIKINHISTLSSDSDEVKKYCLSVLIPGLLKWFSKNDRCYDFVSFFHSFGLSAEFVSSASKFVPELKVALDIALEISASRFYSLYPDAPVSHSYISYLLALFRSNPGVSVPDSVIIFKPCDSNNRENTNSND